MSYRDHLGNTVHHFDIPGAHDELHVHATSVVEPLPGPVLPPSGYEGSWQALDGLRDAAEHWDWLHASRFAQATPPLAKFLEELRIDRRHDPLSTMHALNDGLHRTLRYEPNSTRVDSSSDHCLEQRRGVCQDFSHVFIAAARSLGVPARYVSGYLFHRTDRASELVCDATHAWAEVHLPGIGWIGFDPSAGLATDDRYVRVAVGRDYDDVPPSRGVFKGTAETTLDVRVDVQPAPERRAQS
jgi:transglutaminase-like putative cysteine protease